MTIYRLPEMIPMELPSAPLAMALGNFDGVHEGHRRLLSAARDAAASIPGCLSGVWTFSSLAKAPGDIPALTSVEEKLYRFAEAGLDFAILEDFSAVRNMSPETFVREYLIGRLGCSAAVCGFNFRFGHRGSGGCEDLSRLLAERSVPLTVVDPVMQGEMPVSSTRIRAAVTDGDMETAAALLGRPFSLCLPVLTGKQLGRTLGIPTINQNFPAGHIVPRHGIYACLCTADGVRRMGVANVGTRPSVDRDGTVNCETHILDYDGVLYGQNVRVEFITRLRDEMRFSSLSELRAAMENDIRCARAFFADHPIS